MDVIDEMYYATVFDSCDDETREMIYELMENEEYDLEDAITTLQYEGRL